MGKRKERRLAAMSNAGRRVKLDLFAEPSGDLGGSSMHDEVGGDIDPTQRAGLPKSPSSSGQQPENPLQLLGQYSDDELDEDASKTPSGDISDNLLPDHKDQEAPLSEEKDADLNEIEEHATQTVKQKEVERNLSPVNAFQAVESGDGGEIHVTGSADTSKEMASAELISSAGISDAQASGDVSFGWRIVMHEESNQYYYWNTETGETSWEVPNVLAQTVELNSDHKIAVTEHTETAPMGTYESGSNLGVHPENSSDVLINDVSMCNDLVHQSKEVNQNGTQTDVSGEGDTGGLLKYKVLGNNVHQSGLGSNETAINDTVVVSDHIHDAVDMDDDRRGKELPTTLMTQCECLLERLKSLKGYGDCLQVQDRMSKYIVEVEVRLSDIKSLTSYGSSLLAYWTYSETRLKRLEDAINNDIYQLAVCAQMDDDVKAVADSSCKERRQSEENLGHKSGIDAPDNMRKSDSPVSVHGEKASNNENVCGDDMYGQGLPSSESDTRYVESGTMATEEANTTAQPKPDFHSAEDVDMDVDMDVEDEVPATFTTFGDASSSKVFGAVEPLAQPMPPVDYSSLAPEDALSVPPPPEDEWIPPPPPDIDPVPPPPPDNEQFPPPPPDDPPEPSYSQLPSYTETNQSLSYPEQYNLIYPDSNFQYYGHAVTIPGDNFYGQADASQVALPNASLYYEAVPNMYAETASVLVSSVEPIPYYVVQDGSVPPVPGVVGAASSQLNVETGVVNYDTRTANESVPVVTDVTIDVPASGAEAVSPAIEFPSTSTTIEAPPTTSTEVSVSASSTKAVTATAAIPASLTASKVQSKVLRSKKRTVAVAPSLRSNKKVSSLVDKWKAAKEELKENEEHEPENAYEILEKKRQREIEEWHAKQIASGEARDNANFQPLGGDWRERVKRKRAEAAKDTAKTSTKAPADENQQPDIVELSKGLPSGWQAYWDEASKQVYYGNVITSETTWTRPTK